MKTMKSFLLVAAIAFSSVLSASTNSNDAETKKAKQFTVITDTVEDLLQSPTFIVEDDMTARVTVTINKDNEIVVLSVDCEDRSLEAYLKNRLNYNELPVTIGSGKKNFVIPVRIEAEI